ncbi:MAG: 3-methyl-2-oxobutanoate hydroxymethyltransferase [Candidatus Omnitrophica bacterium]|nr:3-methyl-2-oxobutanoate hydroxymethyltransferase [Candidatus Omnitrophota bacterium]
MTRSKITIPQLQSWKHEHRKITMLTAYDYPVAKLLDEAGIDVILVGDSLGMVVLGQPNTTGVTMEQMLHHAKAVRRGVSSALLVGDMPFGSFHATPEEAIRNAARFVQEAGCEAVKLEWHPGVERIAEAIVRTGIPVMGHVGLTPQTASQTGGFIVQGRDEASAQRILDAALALERAGCFAMVLECIPEPLAQDITTRLSIPAIGIGAGRYCDGQVLVTYDLLGLFQAFTPKFVKRYADLSGTITEAVSRFKQDVEQGKFPGAAQVYHIKQTTEARKVTETKATLQANR